MTRYWAQPNGPGIEELAKAGGPVSPLIMLKMEPWRSTAFMSQADTPDSPQWCANVLASAPDGTPKGVQLFHECTAYLFPEQTMPHGWGMPLADWLLQHTTGKYRAGHTLAYMHWLAWHCDKLNVRPDLLHCSTEGNQVYVMDWQGIDCPQWPVIEALCAVGDRVRGFPKICVGAAGIKLLRETVKDCLAPAPNAFNLYMRNWEAKGLRCLLDSVGWRAAGVRMTMEHQVRVRAPMVPHPWRPGYVPGQIVPDGKTGHVYMYETSEAWHTAYAQLLTQATGPVAVHLDCSMRPDGEPTMPDVEWKAGLIKKHAKKVGEVMIFNTPTDTANAAWSAQYARIVAALGLGPSTTTPEV